MGNEVTQQFDALLQMSTNMKSRSKRMISGMKSQVVNFDCTV